MFDTLCKIQLLIMDDCLNNVDKISQIRVRTAVSKVVEDNSWYENQIFALKAQIKVMKETREKEIKEFNDKIQRMTIERD